MGMFLYAVALARITAADVVFVRHGETLANATGRYNARTLDTFSPKGEAEVAALTGRLLGQPRFDQIYVSPSPRALKTIAPYLKATHQVATIWPELYECCTGRRPAGAHPTRFQYGAKIKIPAALSPYFRVEPDHARLPVADSYNAGLAQVDVAVEEFRRRCAAGRILLVGHSGQGGHMIHALTGKWMKVENAREINVRS